MSISEAHRPGVDRALQSAFGCTNLDTISPLSGGMSGAAIYRIRVGGIAYLLRIEGGRDSFRNPERWHRCMRIAADAALAPRVRYADAGDGVAIMDFIPEQPLALDYAGDRADLMTDLAQTIRALHQAPAFPSLVDYMDGMDAILGPFLASGILDPQATTALFARFAQVQAAWRSDPADLVSSHNDLNPRNILYDGRRLWLVDWESSFLADRYVDLATLANFFAHDAAEEEILLRTYFGKAPDARQRARMLVMRQVNHVFYGAIFLTGAAAERPGVRLPDQDLAGPSMGELHAGLAGGAFALDTWEGRVAYGRSRLAAALTGMSAPEFDAALALVAY